MLNSGLDLDYRKKRKDFIQKKQVELENNWQQNQKQLVSRKKPEKIFYSVKQEAFSKGRSDYLKAIRFFNGYCEKSLDAIEIICR